MKRMLAELEHIICIDLMCDEDMQPWYERFGLLRSHGMVVRKYLSTPLSLGDGRRV